MKLNFYIIYTIMIVLIAGMINSCKLTPTEESIDPILITIPDPNFEVLIREVLEIPERDITNQDMWSIKSLKGRTRNITNIKGIEYCSGLNTLDLSNNSIVSIEELANLKLLNTVTLTDNNISDIKPLVDNEGMGIGEDVISINNNPLNDVSLFQYKPQLQSRGVIVNSNAKPTGTGFVNIIDPNFNQVLLEHLNKTNGQILNTELDTITILNARNKNVKDLFGIEFCINLEILDLGSNQIVNLLPLSYLSSLKDLKLDNNFVEDITSLRLLNKITSLVISNNLLENVATLSRLPRLSFLLLQNNNIKPACKDWIAFVQISETTVLL